MTAATKTLTLVGAGPGLGLSLAKRFAADPDALADRYFDLYERRDQPEIKVGNYIAQALAAAPN